MDLFLREASDRIGDDDVLAKINTLMDWSAFSPILEHRPFNLQRILPP